MFNFTWPGAGVFGGQLDLILRLRRDRIALGLQQTQYSTRHDDEHQHIRGDRVSGKPDDRIHGAGSTGATIMPSIG